MKETTWIIDAHSGELTVEGLQQVELREMAADLLPAGRSVNCARPINIEPLRNSSTSNGELSLRVFRIYHNSVVEGPGRRSVLQTSGCLTRCPNCFVPETHDINGGVEMKVSDVSEILLDPQVAPRDGVTILGGEPFLQPEGLLALMQSLKQRDQHITLYTGYTLEDLANRNDRTIRRILELTDILIDGPFVKELSGNAGEWRGSTNQRIIHHPALYASTNCTLTIKFQTIISLIKRNCSPDTLLDVELASAFSVWIPHILRPPFPRNNRRISLRYPNLNASRS